MSDRVYNAEHVLGAMIDFAHEQVLLFVLMLAFGDILSGADQADGVAFAPGPREMRKPMSLQPAHLADSRPNPELGHVGLWIDGIERRLHGRRNSSHVVWMHPIYELLEVNLLFGNAQEFHSAH